MEKQTDTFWGGTTDSVAVERRVVWRYGSKPGELQISIASAHPVADLGHMGDGMVEEAVLDAKGLKADSMVSPQLVFATLQKSHHSDAVVAATASGREVPILQLGTNPKRHDSGQLSVDQQMNAAKAAMPTAVVGPGDHAVGFLVRLDAIDFYPLLAVNLPAEIESYKEGSGTTTDALNQLPFQA